MTAELLVAAAQPALLPSKRRESTPAPPPTTASYHSNLSIAYLLILLSHGKHLQSARRRRIYSNRTWARFSSV